MLDIPIPENDVRGNDYRSMVNKKLEAISSANRKLVESFLRELIVKRYSISSLLLYVNVLHDLDRFAGRPFKQVEKDDLINFASHLRKKNSERTIVQKLYAIHKFFVWLNDGVEPKSVKWIKDINHVKTKGRPVYETIKEKIISREEYTKILTHLKSPRDQALISLLWDTGARASEVLRLKIKDVHIEHDPPYIFLMGKRRVPLMESLPYLVAWLNVHPYRDDKEAYLWIRHDGRPITYYALQKTLYRACERAGIRRISPHSFRHTRATMHAKAGVSPYALNQVMGWVSSNMWKVYMHLAGRDIDSEILSKYGLRREEDKPKIQIKLDKCPYCNSPVDPEVMKFCPKCGRPLTISLEEKEEMEKLENLTNKVLQKVILKLFEDKSLKKKLEEIIKESVG